MDEEQFDLEASCRSCGTRLTLNQKVPLFKTAESCEAVSSDIIDLLTIFKLNINENDGLPQHICMNCMDSLDAIDAFYKCCKKMQLILWSFYQKIEIKTEVVMEVDILADPLKMESDEIVQSELLAEESEIACFWAEETNLSDDHVSTPEPDLNSTPEPDLNSTPEPDLKSSNADNIVASQRKSEHNVSKEKSKKKGWRRPGGFFSYGIAECKFCKKKFGNVILHQRSCPERNIEICKYCDVETANADKLTEHIDEKHPQRLPACSICSINFPTFKLKRVHKFAFHDRFHCEFCDRHFSKKYGLELHKTRVHGGKIDKPCPICKKHFTSQVKYDYHIETHDPKKLKHQCQFCEKIFHKRHHWEYHQRTHTGEKPFLCEVCGDAFKDTPALNNHHKSHLDPNFIPKNTKKRNRTTRPDQKPDKTLIECPEVNCGRKLKVNTLQKHLKTCHPRNELGEKIYPYPCPFCSQGFKGANGLALHVKCHGENRPYPCKICGSEFKRSQHLASHVRRLHTNEKNFTCEHCHKSFAEKFQLNEHTAFHSDERNFKCPDCPAAFKTNAYLRVHRRLHTGEKPYACMICEKRFMRIGDLYAHHSQHTKSEREFMGQQIVESLDGQLTKNFNDLKQ